VSRCDASQSVGARTLRSPTVQATFPAVGDRVSSHDHPPAFGHTVDRPAIPVVRAVNDRGVISTPFVRWQFSFLSLLAILSATDWFKYTFIFWLRDVGVWLRGLY